MSKILLNEYYYLDTTLLSMLYYRNLICKKDHLYIVHLNINV